MKIPGATAWMRRHPEKHRENNLNWIRKNPEKHRESALNWRRKNPERHRENQRLRNKARYSNEPMFKLRRCTSVALCAALKNFGLTKGGSTFKLLGYSSRDLYFYLSQYIYKFCEDCNVTILTWGNSHRDHIIPESVGKTKEEIIQLNQLCNLRLICGPCNIKKGDSKVHAFNLKPRTLKAHRSIKGEE
jgi:5-methylcytosine-specific restriction endonuclease McrA